MFSSIDRSEDYMLLDLDGIEDSAIVLSNSMSHFKASCADELVMPGMLAL